MDEDEVLSKITKLLEQGCTMLATHHDCGAPLFRCQGEVVCPVCSFADESNSPAKVQPSGLSGEKLEEKSNLGRALLQENGKNSDEELSAAIGNLRAALLAKLRELTAAIQDEHDLHMLKRQLDCLEGLLRALRSLQG
ncbi:MAG: Sjogren's syndrome/scleroderma autoantigen 1 family protein [Methanothrix sp.]|nr:Sjogren's syndrome/scleroderma autoantigen 1 family protein [Methanothrix sp.]MDD4447206.1 Sjogren's syndrome/scleroderma autoantigen 1 family protein [Methanothrix sp.]